VPKFEAKKYISTRATEAYKLLILYAVATFGHP